MVHLEIGRDKLFRYVNLHDSKDKRQHIDRRAFLLDSLRPTLPNLRTDGLVSADRFRVLFSLLYLNDFVPFLRSLLPDGSRCVLYPQSS